MTMRGFLLVGAVSLFAACASGLQTGAGGISLNVQPEAIAAGETITLTLRNDSPGDVGYNLCSSTLEQRGEDGWQPVATDRVCTMELRTLTAGQVTTYPMEVPSDAEAGEFRYVTAVELMEVGTRGGVQSGVFRITR